MSRGVYAAVDQPDVAYTTYGGVAYRCYVYRNVGRGSIEASIFVEQEDGQEVLVDQSEIASLPDFGMPEVPGVDCPRILGSGQHFVVHYIAASTDTITRAVFDLDDFASGWSTPTSIYAMGTERLYDCAMVGGSTDFVLVAKTGVASEYRLYRFESPYGLGDVVFNTTFTIANSDETRVLAVAADDTDDRIMVALEADDLSSDRYLFVAPRVASNGTSAATPATPYSGLAADYEYAAVGICKVEDGEWCVVSEARPADLDGAGDVYYDENTLDARHLLWAAIDEDAAVVAGYSEVPGLHLISRPWTWRSGYATLFTYDYNVYAVVSYKNAGIASSWDQSYGFVLNLDRRNFSNGTHGIVASAIMNGAIDGRPSGESDGETPAGDPSHLGGNTAITVSPTRALNTNERQSWKRINHLSHVSEPPLHTLGPDRKTVVVAAVFWQRLLVGDTINNAGDPVPILTPGMASISGIRFYHEDPWIVDRDAKEPALPASQRYKGSHHRPIGFPVEISGALSFGGGVTQVFDGAQLCELGFFWAPEIVVAYNEGDAPSPAITARSYYYTATYAWTDAKGQLHRSAPANPVQIDAHTFIGDNYDTDNNGTDDTASVVNLLVRNMTVSLKDADLFYSGASPINIEIWRSYYNGTAVAVDANPVGPDGAVATFLFRRVFTGRIAAIQNIYETPTNNRDNWAQVIQDSQTDLDVSFAELLPFQLSAGVGWAVPPPNVHTPMSVIAQWQNRLWGVNPEDPRVIVYSEEILPLGTQYVLPEFNDTNTFRIDSLGEEVTAMQAMDNSLVIFTRSEIFALSGQGNSGGSPGTLSSQVLSRSTGCIEPRSVVLGPPGIFFQSAKGYYLLGRGFELDYVSAGAAIENAIRAAGNIRAATLIEDRHQIRLALNEADEGTPRVAIYDYFHRLWSIASLPQMAAVNGLGNARAHDVQSACSWRGLQGETLHVVLQQGSGLGVERGDDDTVFADVDWQSAAIPVAMDVTVEWIHLAGIAGYKKLRSIGIQLEKTQDVQCTVELYYDRNGDFDETAPDDTFTDLAAAGYIRVRPSIRKCSAVLVRVYESGDGLGGAVPQTENLKITSLTLELGIRKGPRRVPDTRVAT